jgi:hypothetical protein
MQAGYIAKHSFAGFAKKLLILYSFSIICQAVALLFISDLQDIPCMLSVLCQVILYIKKVDAGNIEPLMAFAPVIRQLLISLSVKSRDKLE